jgi:hypothetical protein
MVPRGDPSKWPTSCVCISEAQLQEWQGIGTRWARDYPETPKAVQDLWSRLWALRKEPIFTEPDPDTAAPEWWRIAYALMAIADEASAGVGYIHASTSEEQDWKGSWVALTVEFLLRGTSDGVTPSDRHRRISRQIASICLRADRDVVCVQPKSHTPEVGCTPRSLAHNLALLPPRGEMRAHWQRPPQVMLPESRTDLRLLLIPYPYKLEEGWFVTHPVTTTEEAKEQNRAMPWGWFELRQRWLPAPSVVVELVERLMVRAGETVGSVNGVVFPEYALNWATYKAIADHLRDNHPDVEFFVSGSSDNCAGEKGNFALSSHFFDEGTARGRQRMAATTSRGKHHRWRIDKRQILNYDLGNSLDPAFLWWEKIPLQQREIHVKVIRSASVFTTMICEDLARSDPCHEVLRAIGPNLVFVILMDGPQLPARWSARYATGLSDDPGSAVLTLTSRALIARSNSLLEKMTAKQRGDRKPYWTVGLWKDAANDAYQINCPPHAHGVVLTLHGHPSVEATLDGRQNPDAFSWRKVGDPIMLALHPKRDGDLIRQLNISIPSGPRRRKMTSPKTSKKARQNSKAIRRRSSKSKRRSK